MKYLFGDSEPFPLGINLLATLEAFMTSATKVVELELHAQTVMNEAAEVARVRTRDIEGLEAFHETVLRGIRETSATANHELSRDYARHLSEFATRFVEAQKTTASGINDRDLGHARSKGDVLHNEIHGHFETFFRTAELPQERSELSLRLTAAGYEAAGVYVFAEGVVSAYTLGTDEGWEQPRRVAEFVAKLELRVALKKSWIKGTVSAEMQDLSDWIISELQIDDDATILKLRRKNEPRDALMFRCAGRRVFVEHLGDPNADTAAGQLDDDDVVSIDALRTAIRAAAVTLHGRKKRLLFVRLDGIDVASGSSLPLVERIVELLAPAVCEVADRSPSPAELSLKRQNADGRREEIYLRREELTQKLQPLPAIGRRVFAPFGLETWLPSVTGAPPSVSDTAKRTRTEPRNA
jgi:hypothetical protein